MEIKNVKIYGLEESIIRSGYPMQIGEPEDLEQNIKMIDISTIDDIEDVVNNPSKFEGHTIKCEPIITKGNYERAVKLAKTSVGSGHNNFLKGIIVQFDLKYPQYFTPQLQRYHWIDIVSSQSKMHKLTSISDITNNCNNYVLIQIINIINELIEIYNDFYNEPNVRFISNKYSLDFENKQELFQYIISNLPMGYEMWMGISTNYLQLNFRRA